MYTKQHWHSSNESNAIIAHEERMRGMPEGWLKAMTRTAYDNVIDSVDNGIRSETAWGCTYVAIGHKDR